MPGLSTPSKSQVRRQTTKSTNPKPSTVRIQTQSSLCSIRRPVKKTRQIIRRCLYAPSIEHSQKSDGSFQVTRRHSTLTWEDDDHLYFARGLLSRVTPALREAGYRVWLAPVIPNELQFAALRTIQNRSFRTLGEHFQHLRSRLAQVHQWSRPKIEHRCPKLLAERHQRDLLEADTTEDSLLGEQALWTIAATPLGQLIFENPIRRVAALGHLLSILPPTQTWVVCRNNQDVEELVAQLRQIERRHPNQYPIPWGGVASRDRGSVHILPVSGLHKIPVDRQNITSRRPETGNGAVLPRLLIFWGAELACSERILKLCNHLHLNNTSRFLFSTPRKRGQLFDEMVFEQVCGPMVWHQVDGWFLPELNAEKIL